MNELKMDFQPDKPFGTKGTLIIYESDGNPLFSDTLDIANRKKRSECVKEVSEKNEGIEAEQLEQVILQKIADIARDRQKAQNDNPSEAEKDYLKDTPPEVKQAALDILKSEKLFEQISSDIEAIGIAGEQELSLTLYIIMTSRLLDKPLSAIVQGASASGKSYIIETVSKLMPPEAVIQAHDFSDQALYYLPSGSLVHKIIISGERVNEHRSKDGYAEDNTKAFREMVASGELKKAVTVKGNDGKPKTVIIYQSGPVAYLESTTAANIHDEDATRLLPLATDESTSQTQKVIEAQRKAAKGHITSEDVKQGIIQQHNTLQRLLKPIAVRIPYIDSISLPDTNIATRRTYQQFRYAINSIAFLRQYQKTVKTEQLNGLEYIEADEVDYSIAYRLMVKVLSRKYSPLNQQSRDLLNVVMEKIGVEQEFNHKDCEQWCGISNTTVRRRLWPLESAGIITVNKENKPYRCKVEHPELADVADLSLPLPEDIAERIAIISE